MKKTYWSLALASAVLASTVTASAQSYTVNFTATPPTIDGVASPGEWDAAEPITGFTEHSSDTPEDSAEATTVVALYSVDGLYLGYICTDTDVVSVTLGSERLGSTPEGTPGRVPAGEAGWTFAGTDYCAIYIDPANVSDDATDVDPSFYSYSLQFEPSMTANGEMDDMGNSYNYSEHGRFGGALVRNPNPVEVDGTTPYWIGGLGWDIEGTRIVDGATADGYLVELFIPWSDISYPYYQAAIEFISADGESFYLGDWDEPTVRNSVDAVMGAVRIEGGAVTGMPVPGTTWKVQLARHSASAAVTYVNWVGGTGGFVSRPFGDFVFGDAPASAVAEALMHMNN